LDPDELSGAVHAYLRNVYASFTCGQTGAVTLVLTTPSEKETPMPQILVEADRRGESDSTVVYRERISLSDLESDHFSGQLVERVGWAVLDADELERTEAQRRKAVG
jgi:hypothetical protein